MMPFKHIRRQSLFKGMSSIGLILLLFAGCEEPGVVGGAFIDDEGNLVTNEFPVKEMTPTSSVSYSGRLDVVPMGHYTDPLFGEVTSIGLIRPDLNSVNLNRIDSTEQVGLKLVFNGTEYGDTLSTAFFDVYEVAEPWRGRQLRYGDDISFDRNKKIGSFSIAEADTAVIPMPEDWIFQYNGFISDTTGATDSTYVFDMPGLAIVPDVSRSEKMVFLDLGTDASGVVESETTRLFSEDTTGTFQYQRMADWGAAVQRDPSAIQPQTSYKAMNTFESFQKVDYEFTRESLVSQNLARVEMIFYEDTQLLEQSLPGSHVRPAVTQANIHIVDEGDVGEEVFAGSPVFTASRDTAINGFRFNLTSTANLFLFDTLQTHNYYLTVESNNGLLQQTVLHGPESSDESKRPHIIVTAIE
ncbi:MAG: hypothetical protein RI513_03835 [Balneolaceae bacterium]|nr:hypothetical protein [Balneolaceae bacterium]MDR9446403.1 hypothetical protein [Balneolaceae bacterium]